MVRDYLATECAEGRVLGPLPREVGSQVHISPFGVIPKGTTGRWRLIVDLSSPGGASVNDGIREQACSLSYVGVETAAREVFRQGRGTLLAKVDIKSAYRVVPIHPEDRWLLGMQCEGAVFVDTTLPFGLRSAPKIFTALADAAEWIAKQEGVEFVIHYLDDFLLIGAPGSRQCEAELTILLCVFDTLGFPVAPNKLEGPTCCLTFLGFMIDSVGMEIRLPQDKLKETEHLVTEWLGYKSALRSDLESLVGKLAHAARVVPPGKTFLRRMFGLLSRAREPFHHVRLNKEFQSDLRWWSMFLEQWNGVSLLREYGPIRASHHCFRRIRQLWVWRTLASLVAPAAMDNPYV